MVKVTILGAHGQIAQIVEKFVLADDEMDTTLFLRNASRLDKLSNQATIYEGDAADSDQVEKAAKGADIVYANLAGDNIKLQAQAVVEALHNDHVKRLIWISSLGIYDEVPGKFGEWNKSYLGSYLTNYAEAAKVIEDSDLDYTIVRPAWLTNKNEVDYEKTKKNEAFKGTEVSRKSVAAYVYHLLKNPQEDVRESIGLNKPNTDGDKPSWM
ncbi:MAG: SDR family oxidoreductase [Lactobacillus sp.]|jgi:putative NADH-flavin reductase|nr:SDR family oxidoreductase [Lactobacillus sp.]MCH3905738.1 SDR family oxidoreductase [Lactobacillus sp.]MCH3990693.1 SDR family oxidoreductase [Lactobacillus sp.]MCH4068591.1 SDR family oxidoreductase [Lactobacillus sp.]MCI1304114.1 SDR family oxidoreductase [Lactobacillus sp.]